MSQLTVTSYPPPPPPPDPKVNKEEAADARNRELIWIQENRVPVMLAEAIENLKHCCVRLNLSAKCDERLNVPSIQSTVQKYNLVSRQGTCDNLKAGVTLLDDNVIHAEVTIKHPKAGGGFYRAVAQPDVQWKLQQLQDLGNHISHVTIGLCNLQSQVKNLTSKKSFDKDSGRRIMVELKSMKDEICQARNCIQLPRKRSLLELCYFPPTRKFVPPLPQDQLLSFYISSCRLVCASYQMVPKTVHPQGLSVFMAECPLHYLEEILRRLNLVMNCLQRLSSYIEAINN